MNLSHLRYFVTLARLEHYTQAAELLNITQPSLSHAMSALEQELGVKLFEKEGRNIVLTRSGHNFLTDVELSLEKLDSAIRKIKLTGSGNGRIDLVQHPTASSLILPPFVKGFLEEHPSTNVDFHFHSSLAQTEDMMERLKDRKYDFALCPMIENEPKIDFLPIHCQELTLIVPKNHSLENRTSISLKETLSYPQIGFSKRNPLYPSFKKLFAKLGETPNFTYTVEEDQGVVGLVSAGFGIAIVPKMPILDYLPIVSIPISDSTWKRVFYLASLKGVYQPPIVQMFRQYVETMSHLS